MEFVKENKIILIICTSLILIALFISYLLNGNIFSSPNEYIEVNEYLKNYEINEIVPVTMSEEQMARKYLSEYIKLIILDPNRAYDLIVPEYREKRFGNISKFNEYFEDLLSDNFGNAKVSKLSTKLSDSYKEFYIVDSNKNTFIFREYSIMQYEVMFDIYTI